MEYLTKSRFKNGKNYLILLIVSLYICLRAKTLAILNIKPAVLNDKMKASILL